MKKYLLSMGLVALVGAGLAGCQQGSKKGAESTDPQKAPAAPAANSADSKELPIAGSYAKGGDANAPITIVEFSEFQCPFCSRINPTMKKVQETYGKKVRVVFKHNPLSFHKNAPYASQAALAAGMQGKFWEMHDKLFANQKKLQPADIEGYAKEIGLDVAKFKTDADSKKVKDQLAADMALAIKVGARGTPNCYINGKQLRGAQPFPKFKAAIDAELKAVEALTKAGTKAGDVYAKRVTANFKAPAAAKKAAAKKDTSKVVYKIPVGANTPAKGGKSPLVTIIEFSDFQCPFCGRVNPTMKKIMETYGDKVQIAFRQNPLPFHKNAPLAAEAALAAHAQGKFWPMHDLLFKNQKALLRPELEKYATELGLDMTKFKADLDGGAFKAQIKQDQKIAAQFGARGTPNFFVNGRQVTGARPFPAFKKIIDEEIKKAEALLKAGTAQADLYKKLTEKGLTKAAAPVRKPSKARAEDKTVYKVLVDDKMLKNAKGPADALVTIIEFSDFQCPFCSRVTPTITNIMKKYGKDVRIMFRHSPLPFHKNAPLASEAALAAGAQGKFWPMHDLLFKNQKALLRPELEKYATELGLNVAKFKADLDSHAFKAQVDADVAFARSIGAGGTPNFFINGRKIVGAQPQANFEKIIDAELAKAKALVAKGIARDKVYFETVKNGATKAAPRAGKPNRPKEDPKKVFNVVIGKNDPFKGDANAPITIVEFSDFQCPFCGRVNPTIKKVQEKYGKKVRIVFKQNPLSFHKDAPLAAEATLAAHAQGKFWQMHDILFKNQRALKRPELEKYATELGLDMAKFKADLDSHKYKAQVTTDMAEAKKHGATGTPSFFINGRKLRGAQPFPRFEALIDEELKKKGL